MNLKKKVLGAFKAWYETDIELGDVERKLVARRDELQQTADKLNKELTQAYAEVDHLQEKLTQTRKQQRNMLNLAWDRYYELSESDQREIKTKLTRMVGSL